MTKERVGHPHPKDFQGRSTHLVAYRMKGSVYRAYAHHGVGAPLSRRPVHLPDVKAFGESDPAANTVRTLRHRMPVECEFVVVLWEKREQLVENV
jgi:hypothetical protein